MSEGFNVALQFDLEFGRSMIMTLDSLDHEGEASACLRLVDWHDWPEVARLRDAAQEAIDLIYSKYGDENPSLVELARCMKEIDNHTRETLVRTVCSDGNINGLHSPGTLEDNWWTDQDPGVGTPDAVALIHSFVRPLVAAAGSALSGCQLIRLTTCAALKHNDELMRLVFPTGSAALPAVLGVNDSTVSHFYRLWTEICVGSDAEGTVSWEPPMTDEALETAPLTLRDAVKAARKLQLLTSLQDCVQGKGWIGGVLPFSVCTRPYLSEQGRAVLDGLVARLSAALEQRAHSGTYSPIQLTRFGERLEAQGEYLKAADVYRRALDMHLAANEDGDRLACPPIIFAYLGLAFKRAGRFADAVREYEAGLAYLADTSKPIGCDHPAWRETVRIYLFDLYAKAVMAAADEAAEKEVAPPRSAPALRHFSAADAGREMHDVGRVLRRLFEQQAKFLSSTGDDELVIEMGGDASASRHEGASYKCEGVQTGRRFVVTFGPAPPGVVSLHPELEGWLGQFGSIVAASPRPYRPRCGGGGSGDISTLPKNRGIEAFTVSAMPRLPRAQCAACGARPASMRRCARCMDVGYCGKECQVAHWKVHKKTCKKKQ